MGLGSDDDSAITGIWHPGWVAIAVGTNLPPHAWRYRRALTALARVPGLHLLQATAPLVNAAVGPGVHGRFLNGAVAARVTTDPRTLLKRIKRLERQLGRRGRGDRTADFDLIAWCDALGWRRINTPELTLPHPRAAMRLFVRLPLAELRPPRPWPMGLRVPGAAALARTIPSYNGFI